jgi:hypothetical protein
MGLDMYAYKIKAKLTKEIDFNDEIHEKNEEGDLDYGSPLVDSEEIAYWRKHPDLHGWMERLYRRKGGKEESFNGDPLVLTLQDLDDLKVAILNMDLPETTGFFFGASRKGINPEDLEFIEKAKTAIKEGYTVYYDSSW